jgi:hypothetical protein
MRGKFKLQKVKLSGKKETNYYLNPLILGTIKIELYKNQIIAGLILQAMLHIITIKLIENMIN